MSYFKYGLNIRIHGSAKGLPHNAYTIEKLRHTVTLIRD